MMPKKNNLKVTSLRAEKYLADKDPNLASLIKRFGKCPLVHKQRPPFDVLASCIVSQQLSSKAADTIRARLLLKLRIERPFQPIHFVDRRLATICKCGLSKSKAIYIRGLAKAVETGRLTFDGLAKKNDEEVVEFLTKEPGIGRWTSEMFLMFGLGRLDIFSSNDAGLRRAVRKLYGISDALTQSTLDRLSAPWRPFRSVASWYLWQYIDEPE